MFSPNRYLNPFLPGFFFRDIALRLAIFVYRLMVVSVIGNFLKIPSLIEIKILVKGPIYRMLANNGLKKRERIHMQ